jgi:hypothetical protein
VAGTRKGGRRHVTGNSITTKSWFGSHSDMVIEELSNGKVVCEDDSGKYITTKSMLDSGLADPNRYNSRRSLDESV